MKFLIIISLFVLFICCNDFERNKELEDQNLSFKICDSTYVIEKPIWWDSFDLILIDSLVNASNSALEYRRLLLSTDRKLNREFYSVHPYNYRIDFKLIYYFHKEKSTSLKYFINNSQQYVSYELSARLKSFLFECENADQNYSSAYYIGEEYFNAGLLDESLHYFKLAFGLLDDSDTFNNEYYKNRISTNILKIEGIKNRAGFLKEHHHFRKNLDSLVHNINELRTEERIEGLDMAMNSFIEENFSELRTTQYSMLKELSDYDLALHYLIFEDDYSISKLNDKRLLESIKQSFKDYSGDPNFTISFLYKDNPGLHMINRDEWVMMFYAPGLDWGGAAEFERYEYKNSINMIE